MLVVLLLLLLMLQLHCTTTLWTNRKKLAARATIMICGVYIAHLFICLFVIFSFHFSSFVLCCVLHRSTTTKYTIDRVCMHVCESVRALTLIQQVCIWLSTGFTEYQWRHRFLFFFQLEQSAQRRRRSMIIVLYKHKNHETPNLSHTIKQNKRINTEFCIGGMNMWSVQCFSLLATFFFSL